MNGPLQKREPLPADSPPASPVDQSPAGKRRRGFRPARDVVLIFLSAALAFGVNVGYDRYQRDRHPRCPYPGVYSAVDAMHWLVQKEGQAVVTKDTGVLWRIFGAEARVQDGSGSDTRGAGFREHYRGLLAANDFLVIEHHSFGDVKVDGETGQLTTGNFLVYRTGDGELRTQRNPERSDRWTFARNQTGCWEISRFEYNAAHKPIGG